MRNSHKHTILENTRGRGGLTHHLNSEAPAGNRRMAMTFARLRLIVFLWCIGMTGCPFSYVPTISQNLLQSLYHALTPGPTVISFTIVCFMGFGRVSSQ